MQQEERKKLILDIATKLWSAYLSGDRALDLSHNPEHWTKMATQLVDDVIPIT
jgi:hypothetical protein